MTTTLKKWGNSTAVRIPASVLQAVKFNSNQLVEIREESGRIIIEPAKKVYSLDELLEANGDN
jgi:antitoxin MazE